MASKIQNTAQTVSASKRVPQEIFKRIIDHSLPDPNYSGLLTDRETKQMYGRMSLVSRYWALHARAPVFKDIHLCTRDDAQCLIEFAKVQTLGMNIGTYVEVITLRLMIPCPSPPWVHLVLHLLPHSLFPNLWVIEVDVTRNPGAGYAANSFRAPRTPFYDLPRTIPFPSPRRVAVVEITGLQFSTFARFAAFATSFCMSRQAKGTKGYGSTLFLSEVTLEDADIVTPRFPLAPTFRNPQNHFPSVNGSSNAPWQLLRLFPTRTASIQTTQSRYRRHRLQLLDRDEARHIFTMLRQLPKHNEAGISLVFPLLTYSVMHMHDMVFTLTNTGHVSRIVFKLWNTYSRKDLLKLPSLFSSLTKLDTHASESFVGMDTFVVEIPEDLFAELEPAVHACMPRLAAQGALEVQERRLFLPFQMMVEYWTTVEKREQGTHQAESPTEVDRDTQQATAASEDIERTPEVPAELNGSGGKNAAKERENET